jgi:hypothetical protein
MNLTKKVIVGAVAAFAFSGAANAALVAPGTQNGSLVVYAWSVDATTGAVLKGYGIDTGYTLNQVLASPASFNVTASANFASFFAGVAPANLLYTVLAGDSLSANQRVVSAGTATPDWNVGATQQNVINGWQNQVIANIAPAANGYGVAGTTNEYSWTANVSANNMAPGLNLNSAILSNTAGGTVGTTLNLYSAVSVPNVVVGRTSTPQLPTVAQLANVSVNLSSAGAFTFSNTPVSAVPLPAAVWLLGSGLFGLIGVGRRRLAA